MPPLSLAWLPLLALAAPSMAADPSPGAPVTVQGQARDAKGGAVVLTTTGETVDPGAGCYLLIAFTSPVVLAHSGSATTGLVVGEHQRKPSWEGWFQVPAVIF